MSGGLTYAEELELALLLDGPRSAGAVAATVLLDRGYARRVPPSMMEITAAGVDKLGEQAKARCEETPPDDIFNGNHGFG